MRLAISRKHFLMWHRTKIKNNSRVAVLFIRKHNDLSFVSSTVYFELLLFSAGFIGRFNKWGKAEHDLFTTDNSDRKYLMTFQKQSHLITFPSVFYLKKKLVSLLLTKILKSSRMLHFSLNFFITLHFRVIIYD